MMAAAGYTLEGSMVGIFHCDKWRESSARGKIRDEGRAYGKLKPPKGLAGAAGLAVTGLD